MKVSTCCKAIALLLSYVFCAPLVASGITIEVKEPGTLNQLIADVDDASFPELKITGKINAVDIIYLRAQEGRLAHVERLDLSDVTIVEGGGAYAVVSYRGGEHVIEDYTYTYYFSHEYSSDRNSASSMLGGYNHKITTYTDDCSAMFYKFRYPVIVIPHSVTKIGEWAFLENDKLLAVESKQPILAIGENAFSKCYSLQFFDLSSIKELGSGAFNCCRKFIGTADSTLLLSNIDSIPAKAFGDCQSIKKIETSSALRYVGNGTFYGCESLTECDLPSSVKEIGSRAFYGCKALKSVHLPAGLINIGEGAYLGCTSLSDVIIEGSPYGLSASTFGTTPYFKSLKYDDDNILYIKNVAICESGNLYNKPHAVKFKDGTLEIGDGFCGSKTKITSAEIPSSVRRIGSSAFKSCPLTKINIPKSVEEIGEEAFANCNSLKSITLPSKIKKIGHRAFSGCSSLSGEVIIPESVTYLGENVFESCNLFKIDFRAENASCAGYIGCTPDRLIVGPKVRYLYGISAKNKVTFEERTDDAFLRIGSNCFRSSSFESIALPKGKIEIGPEVFYGSKISSFICEGVVTKIEKKAFASSSIRELKLKDGLEYVEDKAFYECDSLKSVSLGRTVKYIGNHAFYNVPLVDLYLGEALDSLGLAAFSHCDSLKEVVLPQTLKSIGDDAFSWCDSLKKIVFPQTLKSIGDDAFRDCGSLKEIVFPQTLKSIGNDAFRNCGSLEEIAIPDSVTTIGFSTFEGCQALSSISLPLKLDTIQSRAFYGCPNINTIVCHSMVPPQCNYLPFNDRYFYPTLHVYESAIPLYKEANPWSQFKMEAMTDGGSGPEQCATPIVSFADGRLHFTCDTEGAEVFYTLKCPDVISYEKLLTSEDVPLEAYYEITCYAKAKGYLRSHVANAKLYWVRTADVENNINDVYMRGVTVQVEGNIITISGLNNNEEVSFYTIDGKYIGHSRAISGKAVFSSASTGTIVIIKIGDNSLKISI